METYYQASHVWEGSEAAIYSTENQIDHPRPWWVVQRALCRLGYDLRTLWMLIEGEYGVCYGCSWQESAAFWGLAVEEALSHSLESYIMKSSMGLTFFFLISATPGPRLG